MGKGKGGRYIWEREGGWERGKERESKEGDTEGGRELGEGIRKGGGRIIENK
jgi:hypothetical protein